MPGPANNRLPSLTGGFPLPRCKADSFSTVLLFRSGDTRLQLSSVMTMRL